MIRLKNGNVITPYRMIKNADVVIEDEKILGVGSQDIKCDEEIDLTGLNVSPGFIDMHIHGGGGYEFWSDDADEIISAAKFHARYGATSVVPTVNYGVQIELNEEVKKKFDAFNKAKNIGALCADLLGLHIEGPNVSPNQPMVANQGVNPAKKDLYEEFVEYAKGDILRWTAAPEIDGVYDMIEDLSRKGVYMSVGHSEPDVDMVYKAYELGATHVTHLYSGMNMVHRVNGRRFAGLLEAAYSIDGLYAEVVANGAHLSGDLLKLIYKVKGADKMCIVSDATSMSGTPDGPVVYNGKKGFIDNGVILREDKSGFMGSAITYDKMLKNLVELANIPLVDAVRMCTATPAKSLGLGLKKGVLTKGFDADIVAFDDDINIKLVICKGKILYQA